MKNKTSLPEQLPYWEFEYHPVPHAILSDGSLSSGFELLPLDVECYDEARINQLTSGLRSFVNSLPDGITCQLMVRIDSSFEEMLAQHQSLATTENQFLLSLDQARASQIKRDSEENSLFSPRLYLFLKTGGAKRPGAFAFRQTKRFASDFSKGHEDRLQKLTQAIDGAFSSLSSLGFKSLQLTRKNLIEIIYDHLNPHRALDIDPPVVSPRPIDLEGATPRSQLVFGDLILNQEDFTLDSKRTRVITLKTLPEMTFAGMMNGFAALPFKHELFFTFHIPDQAREMQSLEQKRRMAHSLSSSTSNRVSDLESESRLSQTTELIREIIETGQRIFHAELTIVLREDLETNSLKDLNLKTKAVIARFKTLSGSEGIQETVGAWKIFKNSLPLAPTALIRAKKMKTNNLVDFLPVYGASAGDDLPVCLLGTRRNTLYSFNPYDSKLTNYNMLVTGSSGSGKSFANNILMLQQIARGTRVFIIDIGGSYKKMTEALNGQYFEMNLSDQYSINPLHLTDPSHPPSGERLKGLVSIIEQMIVDHGEKLSRYERVQIETVLADVFERARKSSAPESPYLSDFANACLSSPDAETQRMGKLMYPWIGDSPFGKLLDRPGRISTDRSIVTFDLKGLSLYPDLQSVMVLILTNFILEQIELDRSVSKRVILDEAWELLKSPAASQFMEYAARTFRKTGSGITFITQGIEEIVSSGIGPAILGNTATKLVMLQKGDTHVLRDNLKLNSQEMRLVQSLEQRKGLYSEGFFMESESRQIIRFQPSPLEYWISTSDARDNQYLHKLMEDGLSLLAALTQAAKVAPQGVTNTKEDHL